MLLVKTEVRISPIHGLGLFAAQVILKDMRVWKYDAGFDWRISKEQFDRLPVIARETLQHDSVFWNGGYCIFGDNSRFINHSESPNLIAIADPDCDVAARKIEIGEELTEDYRTFAEDDLAFRKLSPMSEVEELKEWARHQSHGAQ